MRVSCIAQTFVLKYFYTQTFEFEEGEKTEVGETAVCNLSSVNLKQHKRMTVL